MSVVHYLYSQDLRFRIPSADIVHRVAFSWSLSDPPLSLKKAPLSLTASLNAETASPPSGFPDSAPSLASSNPSSVPLPSGYPSQVADIILSDSDGPGNLPSSRHQTVEIAGSSPVVPTISFSRAR